MVHMLPSCPGARLAFDEIDDQCSLSSVSFVRDGSTICRRVRSPQMDASSRSSMPRRRSRTAGTTTPAHLLYIDIAALCVRLMISLDARLLLFVISCAIFSTAIGIKCTDGIIMGVEKTLLSKMLVPGTHRRVYAIDRHVGLVRFFHSPACIHRQAAAQ